MGIRHKVPTPIMPQARRAPRGERTTHCTDDLFFEARAAFKTVLRSGWQACRIVLTSGGLILSQGQRTVLEVPADQIIAARIESVRFALGRKKEALCLEYRSSGGSRKLPNLWLTGMNVRALQEKLADLAGPLDLDAVEGLERRLDPDAESIVKLLCDRHHATIGELAEHTQMPSHMDILLKIKEVINPLAEELLGFPLVVFVPARHDPSSGEDVLNSWWVLSAGSDNGARRAEILVDTFDEVDSFTILACVPCGKAGTVNVSFAEGEVEILAGADSWPLRVAHPPGLDPRDCRRSFRNGILELRWDRRDVAVPAVGKRER